MIKKIGVFLEKSFLDAMEDARFSYADKPRLDVALDIPNLLLLTAAGVKNQFVESQRLVERAVCQAVRAQAIMDVYVRGSVEVVVEFYRKGKQKQSFFTVNCSVGSRVPDPITSIHLVGALPEISGQTMIGVTTPSYKAFNGVMRLR